MGTHILRVRHFARALAFILISASLAAPAAMAAEGSLKVTGTVTSSDGTPIGDALVTLVGVGGRAAGKSNKHGHFKIKGLPSGTYTLSASAAGYAGLTQRTVTIGESDEKLTLVLSRATTSSLTTIGHVSTSAGETVSTSSAPSVTLSAQQAAAAGTTAVSDMVWSQLGTTPVLPLGGGSNATVSFALRGPDPTETLVDIDGHQMNNGNTGDFDLSLLDPAALQDVQLVYGISPSSLVGPNTLGGAINILTLEPTTTPHALIRAFGGSYGSFGETVQATGTDDRFGYAFSLHGASSDGSVNQSVLAPPDAVAPPTRVETLQTVGSGSFGESALAKLRYQLGGENGYGYLQLDFRDQAVYKDESALLTNYTPPGPPVGGGDDVIALDDGGFHDLGGYQSFNGTTLGAHQANYGFDAQLPLGGEKIDGAPATVLQLSHLTTVASQSVGGPGEDSAYGGQYLYNQRDQLGDDWLEIDHHFASGALSFKYDLGTEALTTDFVQGQVQAQAVHIDPFARLAVPFAQNLSGQPATQVFPLSQTERSAVLRYNGDPTSHIHYSLAAYESNFSVFGSSFNPRAGFVWTPTGNTAVRASVGTTFQAPYLTELLVPPAADQVRIGGVIYVGNPNLQPDHATEYDLGGEQIFGKHGRQLHLAMDVYRTNLRSPSSQLNVVPVPHCQSPQSPDLKCPLSYPVNAGDGVYRGIDVHAEQELGEHFRLRAGWDVDSSYLTVIPPSIQDGTLQPYEQSLGQPLHKAYFGLENAEQRGLSYGADLDYEGTYNELNRTPYATLAAHITYRNSGFEFGLYGTNLTNAYAVPFTIEGGGILYGGETGQPMIPTPAFALQGRKVVFVVTRSI